MSHLFSPFRLGNVNLANRIIVAPMCQYSASHGNIRPWHEQHLGHLMCSGAGAVTIEATAVEPIGRVTEGCLGLWDDLQESLLADMIQRLRTYSSTPIGIQLNHAGRKASAAPPWDGGKPLLQDIAWTTVAPSAIPWDSGWPVPEELSIESMERIEEAFVTSALRAERANVDFIELHGAHGYLIHSFLSPISNQRNDEFGGDLANRMRYPLRILAAVRKALSPSTTLGMRINGTDWLEQGWSVDDAKAFAMEAEKFGLNYLSVSSGGACGRVRYPQEPGYQLKFANQVRSATSHIPVTCAGLINDPMLAEEVISTNTADFIALGRAFLNDPRWPIHAAQALESNASIPRQYQAISPGKWPIRIQT